MAELQRSKLEVQGRLEFLERGHGRAAGSPLAGRLASSSSSEEDLVEVQKNDTDHPVESKEGYAFAENCWDAVICFGHPSIGLGSSLVLLFLLIFTVFLQLVFCYMVYTSFTENPFEKSSVTALRYWRIDQAHQASQTSKNSLTSLAARACDFDKSLATSFSEKEIAENVFQYGFSMMSTGFVMCSLALVAWFSTMIAEFQKLLSFTVGLFEIPRGKTVFHLEDGEIVLVRLARKRLFFILMTVLLRAGVLCILLWYGTVYLVYTETVQDLLLNAVALKFVLEVAELLFDAFAPRRSRSFIENLRPLNLESIGHSHHDCLVPVFFLMVLVALMIVSMYVLMLPSLDARKLTWEGICGGNRNFATAVDGLGRLHWSNTEEYKDLEDGEHLQNYIHEATHALISDAESNAYAPMSIYEPSFQRLRNVIGEETIVEAGASRRCADADADEGKDYWSNMGRGILRMATENDHIDSCADVAPYCTIVGLRGLRARQWCPSTCGCGQPFSGLLLDKVQNGCPSECVQKRRGEADRSATKCQDQLLNLTAIYAKGAQALFTQRGYISESLTALAQRMETEGCDAVAHGDVAGRDFCVGNSMLLTRIYFRSVKYVCPVACGCDGSGLPGQKRDLSTVSAVESGLRLSGDLCEGQAALNDTKFAPHGAAGNGAPVFLSEEGDLYLYHGPKCEAGHSGIRWYLSPTLCNPGYYLAYAVSEDPTRPPASDKWYMDCRNDGWKQIKLNFSPIVGEVVAGSIFDRVNKTIQITSPLCSSRKALMNDVFQLQGETDNGAPLFKSLRGNYLYHGPRCGIGQTGKKWIISPLLCSQGFSLAYRQTEDGTAPPLDDEWMVNCDRSGWQLADIQFSVVPMIGRIRTGASFCLEVFQRRAVLQPCNTDDAQLWIYNTTSGQLRDRNGLCLEATGLPVLETQAIGIPVAMGDCLDDSSAQSWEYNTDSEQVKLKNLDQCLDAAQPDTIGGRVQIFLCHIGNRNQEWTYSQDL